jgi:putative membrane-bound dehydrogenase-like protein
MNAYLNKLDLLKWLKTGFVSILLLSIDKNPFQFANEYPLDLYLPDDLEVHLWAESPMLYNPSNMDTDAKGRIWVTEAVNYRKFNREGKPFLHREEGDRIVILTDSDQDGKADQSKVFVQDKDLISPMGIAVLGNVVLVSCSPHLIKYTDTDGDDKPDKKEILLTGFGGFDHDHSLHSVVTGPDGAYYVNVGNAGPHQVTDKSGFTLRSGSLYTGGSPYNLQNQGNQKSDDGKIWVGGLQLKMNADATGLKVLAHNFRNSFETYVDGMGNMWQNDNDDQVVTCRVSWLAEGGNAGFFSEDGTRYWNADHRPNQTMWEAHWHQNDPGVMPAGDNTGAGSPTGMLRIEGDGLGVKYRGMVLSCDAGRNVLFGYQPYKSGSGYHLAGKKSIFLSANKEDDPAYEWNNKAFFENKSKWFRPSDALIGTDGALYVADWFDAVVGGHQVKDEQAYGRIYRITPKRKKLKSPVLDFSTPKGLILAFNNPAVHVRHQAFNALKSQESTAFEAARALVRNKNPFTAGRAYYLMGYAGDKGIDFLKNKLTYGTEDQKIVAFRALRTVLSRDKLLEVIKNMTPQSSSFLRREMLLALEKETYSTINTILPSLLLPYQDAYFNNAVKLVLGEEYVDLFYKQNKELLEREGYFDLLFTLHPNAALDFFKNRVLDTESTLEKRKKALTAIGFMPTKEAAQATLMFKTNANQSIAAEASYWLVFRSSNLWSQLHDWSDDTNALEKQKILFNMLACKEKVQNVHIAFGDRKNTALAMAKNEIGAQILIDLYKKNILTGAIADSCRKALLASDLPAIRLQAQSLNQRENENLSYPQAEVLGLVSHTAAGKEVFNTYCIQCHQINRVGIHLGPDLTHINTKLDKSGLYEAIVYPSSSIVFGYEALSIEMKDENRFYGFLLSENENSLTIKDLAGKQLVLKKSEVKSKVKETKSLMPAAKSLNISHQELADLLEYLSSSKL